MGKEFAKYKRSEFSQICKEYLASKDVTTQGTGLDIYAKGRYEDVTPIVRGLILDDAKNTKKKNANAEKASKILGSNDSSVVEAKKIKEAREAEEEAKKKAEMEKKNGVKQPLKEKTKTSASEQDINSNAK